jgi:hypothetical protein
MITRTDIEKYFVAEKQESLLFVYAGLVAIVIAVLGLFLWKTQFWKGAAIVLAAIAVIQIIAGYTVYRRCDSDRTKMVYALDMNPDQLKNKELPRMEKVNRNFMIYRCVEIALFVAGILLIALYRKNIDKQFWFGFGVALAVQAALTFGADSVAAKRASIYTEQLKTLLK